MSDYASEYGNALGDRPVKFSAKTFLDQIAADPTDRTTRGVAADYLEENDLHADPDTLHTLRHHDGPVQTAILPHPEKGEVVVAWGKHSINSIKKANADAGHYWFSKDTMKHHGTRLLPLVYSGPGGVYFVSSDLAYSGARGFTVRRFFPSTGHVKTEMRSQQTPHSEDAKKRAREFAAGK